MDSGGIFAVLKDAPLGAYAVSLDQTIVFWNRAAERMLGHTADEVIGRRCFEAVASMTPAGLTQSCRDGCPVHAFRFGEVPRTFRTGMLTSAGHRKDVLLTPMLVAGTEQNAPLVVHLLEDPGAAAGAPRESADSVRTDLIAQGSDAVSDHPVLAPPSDRPARLAPRELEVLRLVAQGRSTVQIAQDLNISPHTVRNHVRHFRQKLGAKTKLEAVLTAVRLGILDYQ